MSCDRRADRAANDTVTHRDSLRADTTVAVPTFREWLPQGGRYLLVRSPSVDTAVVVFPEFTADSTITSGALTVNSDALTDYDFWSADGTASQGRLTSIVQAGQPGCEHWPLARLLPATTMKPWTIGLRAGRAQGIAYGTIDQMAGRDSATTVVDLARLASQAPNDTSVALRGLPYVVRVGYRATLGDSLDILIGEAVRRLNIEANPKEERTTVIGERVSSDRGLYTLAYSERLHGDEESVPTTELIGLIRFATGPYAAFAARDYSDGGTYLMFVRERAGVWRQRWQSAYAGC